MPCRYTSHVRDQWHTLCCHKLVEALSCFLMWVPIVIRARCDRTPIGNMGPPVVVGAIYQLPLPFSDRACFDLLMTFFNPVGPGADDNKTVDRV